MNILILGSGGREHALAWKIRQSRHCNELFIAPGNPGTALCGTNLNFSPLDFDNVRQAVIDHGIAIVIVGPEEPLVKGIYDFLKADPQLADVVVVGPSAAGAQLEGSKAFSKHFMQRHNIPTAAYAEFTKENIEDGKRYINGHSLPIVLKADGLAAGKGVVIAQSHDEALSTFEDMIIGQQFGEASSKVVIESFLEGIEVSVFALTNGKEYKVIGHAKDYKRIGEGDTGPNTGGMGCVTPVPFMDEVFMNKVTERIIEPTIRGLAIEELNYHGFVFFGLMNVKGDPYVIEYNCRMGDPETEVVMPRLNNDLLDLFIAMHQGKLNDVSIEYDSRSIATVVAVSGGYPGNYKKDVPIAGLDQPQHQQTIIFHAGTKKDESGVLTNGGRVLAVTSYGSSIPEAVTRSIGTLRTITFDGMYFRSDIGYEFAE